MEKNGCEEVIFYSGGGCLYNLGVDRPPAHWEDESIHAEEKSQYGLA